MLGVAVGVAVGGTWVAAVPADGTWVAAVPADGMWVVAVAGERWGGDTRGDGVR